MIRYKIGDRLVNNNKCSDFYDQVGYVKKISLTSIHIAYTYKSGFIVIHKNTNAAHFIKIEKNTDEKISEEK